jgi:hypothetical protein
MGQFVAIRMIVLDPVGAGNFEKWMTDPDGFLDKMWGYFQPSLTRITFLKGNKAGARQSYQRAGSGRADSTPAGANADYAWITYWTNKQDNQAIWKANNRGANPALDLEWYNDVPLGSTPDDRGLWNQFLDRCYSRGDGATSGRPPHGPPYDYRGQFSTQYGRGAGCLVEGFEVVEEWPRGVTSGVKPSA